MTRPVSLLSLLFLSLTACNKEPKVPDNGSTDTQDTQDTADTQDTIDTADTLDTADTADTVDTGDTAVVSDIDGDGYSIEDGDCDDNDSSSYPGAEDIPGDGIDQDCDGFDSIPDNAELAGLSEGAFVITELFTNPNGDDDALGEWFEIYNASGQDINIQGLTVTDLDLIDPSTGQNYQFVMAEEMTFAADSFMVFAAMVDLDTDGNYDSPLGIVPDVLYPQAVLIGTQVDSPGILLANGSDGLSLSYYSTTFDSVSYDNGQTYPDPDGASISLDPQYFDALDNDDGIYWCAASSLFYGDPNAGDAQYGTPGTDNDSCPIPVDEDGDGYNSNTDCNDDPTDPNAPSINPGAADSSVDGIDQNCDGIDGPDADGDGYVDLNAGGDDCNDDPNDADGDGIADGFGINPAAADETADGIDQDCDGNDGPYVADFTVDDLQAGDLIITEFLADPDAVSDGDGEWIEFRVNPALGGSLDLQGLVVADLGSNSFTVSDSVIVFPGDHVLFAKNGDAASNGGVTAHYDYGSAMSLSQSGDSIILSNSTIDIDSVIWNSTLGFSISTGASTTLEPGYIDASLNDDGANWCDASSVFGAGDLGTPGLPNDSCGLVLLDEDGDGYTNDIDCNDSGLDLDGDGTPDGFNTNPDATDSNVDGIDQNCDGIDGPDADNDGYVDLNAGGDDCDDGDNAINPGAVDNTLDGIDQNCDGSDAIDADGDGYVDASIGGDDCNDDPTDPNAPSINPGEADSSIDGIDQNCDGLDGPDTDGDGYVDLNAGGDDCNDSESSINPGAVDIPNNSIDEDCDGSDNTSSQPLTVADLQVGDLVINEVMQNPAAVGDNDGEWFEIWVSSTLASDLDLDGLIIRDQNTNSFTVAGPLVVAPNSYVVFAKEGDPTVNGGLSPDYVSSSSNTLGNTNDDLVLEANGLVIDEISWDNGATFPDPNGATMTLAPSMLDSTSNDDGTNWCEATSSYGDGDLGTPGAPNDTCN